MSGYRAAAAIAVTALLLRVGYAVRAGVPVPRGDSLEYHSYAVSLLTSGEFEGPEGRRSTRMPGYPFFLACVYRLFGPSVLAVQLTQCALGALTCLLLFACARELLAPPWALASGLAAACYYDLLLPCSALMTEALYGFLLALSLAALYRRSWPAGRRCGWAGFGLGLAYLVRPEILPFACLILLALPIAAAEFSWKHAVLGAGMVLLLASFWVGRSAAIFRRLVPVTTVGGFNLYLGLRLPLQHQSVDLGPLHEAPAGAGELARDEDFLRAYRELRRGTPWLRRWKAYAFNLFSAYYPFLPQYDVTYALLVPFWLAGLWWALRSPLWWPVAAMLLGLSAVYAFLAGPVSRYRFGLAPLLILLAGFGAQRLQEGVLGSGRLARWGSIWAAANLAVWLWAPRFREAVLWLKGRVW